MGFPNISTFATAPDNGKSWFTQFRKAVPSAATTTYNYFDYTYSPGSPVANFYASTPLEAAVIDSDKGIYIPSVAPATQCLKNITVMSSASSATSTTNSQQQLTLCDYLMYYPFIDTDSTDQQDMTQTATIPRYESGMVIAIAQSASSTVGQFTMNYTNQDGVAGRVSRNAFTLVVGGGGQSLKSDISANGLNPFVPLQAGDSGVKSIESVTFTAVGGGLMCLVIVKPLQTFFLTQECRRTTSGNLESYGAASSVDSLIQQTHPVELKDGAILGLLAKGCGGSLASSTLIGTIETVWN